MTKLTKDEVGIVLKSLMIQEMLERDESMKEEVIGFMRGEVVAAMERVAGEVAPISSAHEPALASVADSIGLVIRNVAALLIGPSLSPAMRDARPGEPPIPADQREPIQVQSRLDTNESTLRVHFDAELSLVEFGDLDVTVLVNGTMRTVTWIDTYDSTLDIYIEGELSGQLSSAEATVGTEGQILVNLDVDPPPTS